jgi:hypothetical protein
MHKHAAAAVPLLPPQPPASPRQPSQLPSPALPLLLLLPLHPAAAGGACESAGDYARKLGAVRRLPAAAAGGKLSRCLNACGFQGR